MFILIRPVGFRCHLECGYCYYKAGHDRMGTVSVEKMPADTIRRLLSGLPDIPGGHTLCLHGGEPLLIGKRWFQDLIAIVHRYNSERATKSAVTVALQTNAMLIDDDWIALFKAGDVGVSVSLDGPEALHDGSRVDRRQRGTHSRVFSAIERLGAAGIRVGALAVITANSVAYGAEAFYDYFKTVVLQNGLDVTPYIETGTSVVEHLAREKYEADAREVSQFLCRLFDRWLYDDSLLEIRMFGQLVGVALGFTPSLCSFMQGASCGRTPTIMPSGDVYACDLEVDGFDFRMGSLVSDSIADICSPERIQHLQALAIRGMERRGCTECELLPFCSLTCPRHTFSDRDHKPYCAMMFEVVDHVRERLSGVARSAFNASLQLTATREHPAASGA